MAYPSNWKPIDYTDRRNLGTAGEHYICAMLHRHGWHTSRFDCRGPAVNGDLVALKGGLKPVVQVKTTEKAGHIYLGYSGDWMRKGKPFFNAYPSPIVADVVACVTWPDMNAMPVLHLFTVGTAERLARWACDCITGKGDNFPVHVPFKHVEFAREAWPVLEGREVLPIQQGRTG